MAVELFVGPVGPVTSSSVSQAFAFIGPVVPRRRKSVITRGGTLGCGEYRVAVEQRGGGPELMRLDYTQLHYTRVWSDTGELDVDVAGLVECAAGCEDLRSLVEWRHELVIYRDDKEVARGPLTKPTVTAETGKLEAMGMSGWLSKRLMHRAMTPPVPVDPADLAGLVVVEAMRLDPSPGLVAAIQSRVGVPVAPDLPIWQKASDAFRTITESGMVWTDGPGRIVYIGGAELFDTSDVPLLRAGDFASVPSVEGDGYAKANAWVVIPEQQAADLETGEPTITFHGEYEDATMAGTDGLLEDVTTDPGVLNEIDATNSARLRTGATREAPRHITEGVLAQDAPVTIDHLYPGRLLRVSLPGCLPAEQLVRLAGVDVTATPSGEAVRISMTQAVAQ